jgi:glycosyltransferase involved in cell wall biosynthesis
MSAKVSVVVPVYNSSKSLEELLQRTTASLADIPHEIILVNDGSKDDSWKTIAGLKERYGNSLIGVNLSRNFGQHSALVCGFSIASGELIITMDDDLQHPPEEIGKLIATYDNTQADVVYGIPENKQHSGVRNAGSYFVRKSSRYLENKVEGSSFRLIRATIAKKTDTHHHNTMLFIDEILSWYTSNYTSVTVRHDARKHGQSTYSYRTLFRLYLDVIVNHSAAPLQLMTWLGLIGSLVTFAIGTLFIIRKFIYDVPIGFTVLIVAILFTGSILLMCMGIIGRYLYKLYQLQNRKPGYVIRERV